MGCVGRHAVEVCTGGLRRRLAVLPSTFSLRFPPLCSQAPKSSSMRTDLGELISHQTAPSFLRLHGRQPRARTKERYIGEYSKNGVYDGWASARSRKPSSSCSAAALPRTSLQWLKPEPLNCPATPGAARACLTPTHRHPRTHLSMRVCFRAGGRKKRANTTSGPSKPASAMERSVLLRAPRAWL